MTQEIYVTEIDKTGIVKCVNGSLNSNNSTILPHLGDSLFELKDSKLSIFFSQTLTQLFSEITPTTFTHSISDLEFQLIFHAINNNCAFIYWQCLNDLVKHNLDKSNTLKTENKEPINDFHRSLSLDFIDTISLPIFELTIYPKEKYHFNYVNQEMLSLFPNLDITDENADLRIILSNLDYSDKEQFINTLENIDSSKTWTSEFRLYFDDKIKWFKGIGHFSKIIETNSYTLRGYLKDITDKKKVSSDLKLVDFAFRNAVIPIYYVNKDATLYDFNAAANLSLGYTRDELKNMRIQDFDSFYTLEKWKNFWSLIKRNKSGTFQTIHTRKDGTEMVVHIVGDLIYYNDQELICAYVLDLTEKQKLESQVLLADFSFMNINTPIHIISKDGSVFKSNPAAQALLGYNEEEYTTLKITDIDPFYNEEIWPSHWEYLKKTGKKTFTTFNKKSDGSIIPVEIIANYLVFEGRELNFAFFSDISQRVAEEERLRLLESAIIHTNDAIIITDAQKTDLINPVIIYVNPAFTKITGYTSDDVIGKNPKLLQSGKSSKHELDKMRNAIINQRACEATLLNVKKNGDEFWINTHINPVANNKGVFTHFIAVQRDITQQKKIELERERVLEELVAKNKKLREFSFITTHNLRAPLTNLLSASRMIKKETIENPLTRTLIDIFKKSTNDLNDTLNTLINTLLIHENTNVKMEMLSFKKMFEKVCSINSDAIANNCCLISTNFSAVDEIFYNAEYLESIFQNLITNSIKYADPSRQARISIVSKKIGENKIQLIFSDNGIGMDMNIVKGRIFGLNQRFHDHPDSKGVGLHIVHSQIIALGGTISVSSEVNLGTIFIINFKHKQND